MKKSTIGSIALIVLLAVIAYLVMQRPGERSRSDEEVEHLVDYDSAAVSRFEITSKANGHIVVERQGGKWMITDPINFPAAEYMVIRVLETGRQIELKNVVSTNPDKQGLFQVDSTGTLVKYYEGETEKAAFRVGKPTTSFTETYVRAEGSNDVYIAMGTFATIFDRKPLEWRDKTIFHTERESLTGVRFAYGDTTFSVTKADSVWSVGQVTIGEPTSFIASVSSFETQGFIDTTITKLPPLTAVLSIGEVSIRFHFDDPTDTYLVQTSTSPQWFSVPIWKAKQLLLREKDFLAMKR
jgi:hypothetical protein